MIETSHHAAQRAQFIAICQRAFALGLQLSTGGNLSLRLGLDHFLVKPSGLSLVELTEADLVICDGQGKVLQGQRPPTKEMDSHLALYGLRPRVGAVVHYHAPHATAWAVAGRAPDLPTVHARRILGRLPLLAPPAEGGQELAGPVRKGFADPGVKAALLAGHGLIAVGANLREAQNLAELVEESARVAWLAAQIPATGEILS